MSFSKTCSCLVLLTFLFNSLNAHQCVHDQMNYTLKTVDNPHQSKHFTRYAASDYRGIQMAFDFSNMGSASKNLQTYIKEILLPPVQTFWEATLKVPPTSSRIYVPSGICSDLVDIPYSASLYGYAGDIVIFVGAVYEPTASYLAKSMPCGIDTRTKRPTIGLIIFNTYYIKLDMKETTIESDISTTLHEITHVLGFSKLLYPYYVNPDTLQTLTGHVFNKTVNGVPTMVLNLPPLTKRLRAHFNCSTLEGAYLENEGGPGSFGAHFERRVFYNEFMTASMIRDLRISEFALALLEGTGWYQVNYKHAEPMTYGKNEGCVFLNKKCMDIKTLKPRFKEFCSPLTQRAVSWTYRGFGYCGTSSIRTSQSLRSDFDYWGNKTVVDDGFADNCPQVQIIPDYDCEEETNKRSALLGSYEFYGVGGKSFAGTLSKRVYPFSALEGYCFKTKCLKKSDGNYSVFVNFAGKGNVTCNAAEDIDAENFPFTHDMVGKLQCPDPNDFCQQVLSEGYCKGGCYGNGVCQKKECDCYGGWTSHNCAKRKMIDQYYACTHDSLRTTRYGDECICNPSNTTCQCLLGLKTGSECGDYNNNDNENTDNNNDNENTNNNNDNENTNNHHDSSLDTKSEGNGIGGLVFKICLILIVIAILAGVFIKKRQSRAEKNPLANPLLVYQQDEAQNVL